MADKLSQVVEDVGLGAVGVADAGVGFRPFRDVVVARQSRHDVVGDVRVVVEIDRRLVVDVPELCPVDVEPLNMESGRPANSACCA